MKKWKFFLIFLLIIAISGLYLALKNKPQKLEEQMVHTVPVKQDVEKNNIVFTDVKTTEELKNLFKDARYDKMPKIFIRRFPDDFAQKGNPALFAAVLLPHLLHQNELLEDERDAFIALNDKIRNGEPFTQSEEAFWNELVMKYEVLNPDKDGQKETLYNRVDCISPSLAVAQALEATDLATKDFDAPFGVRRWNDKKEYDFVHYANLSDAVSDYALELNRGRSYFPFHVMRTVQRSSIRHPLLGRSFAKALAYYKIEDPAYTNKLDKIFERYKIQELDESKFEKEK